ncbi:MAG: TonB-dependent receptor [Steroidobacteraceae bacterium]|nr:TonB-dependent receptor [Steroidobacteraceae bacterium]
MNSSPWLLLLLAGAAEAAAYRGMPLDRVLEELRAGGLELLYSSDLVKPWMRVAAEPQATEPRARLEEILAPHGIRVSDGPGGTLILVRDAPRAPRAAAPGTAHRPAPAPLETVVVSASHYLLGDEPAFAPAHLSNARLEALPEIGEDPVRAVARLPGVARQDFSSRVHLRGGADNETLFRFDDLRLYNPYHLKDFFGVFSSIDPGIVSDIRVYTGGFPVHFGDRSSGVVDIAPRLPGARPQGQAVLSLMTAGVALDGGFAGGAGDWAFAARRGNMDLFFDAVDSTLGEPDYHDLYAHAGRRLNGWLAVSANALVFDDRILAFDSDQEEEARAEYRDAYWWLRFDLGEPDGRGGRILAARTELESERDGSAELPGVASGTLSDERHFTIHSLQADGWWRIGSRSLLQAGGEWREQRGRYLYSDAVDFELLFLTPGASTDESRTRSISLRPSGHQAGAYLNWRFEPAPAFATDLGLRWDTGSLAERDGAQWSPRAVLMWRPRDHTRLRFGWGRYFQAQAINELQVPDGEVAFQRAQRATHHVASIEHDLSPALTLRAEAYRKDYDRPLARHENLLNTLVVLPELKPDRILIAPDAAVAEGVEVSLNYERGNLAGWLSYTHSRVRDRVDGEWLARSWDQRDYASAGLHWRNERWEASFAATWHRGWPTTEVQLVTLDPFPLAEAATRNGARIGDYARVDLRLARRFVLESAGEITAFVEVNNLLKRNNECCVEYQIEDEEEAPFLDVGARGSLPLIPSLGILWKF